MVVLTFFSLVLYITLCLSYLPHKNFISFSCLPLNLKMIYATIHPILTVWNATSIIYWFIYVLRSVYKHLKIIRQLVSLLLLHLKIILVHINIILIVTIIIINPIIILIAVIYWPWLHIVFKHTMPDTFIKYIWFVFQITPRNKYNYNVCISAK